jgi:hypothetical protein
MLRQSLLVDSKHLSNRKLSNSTGQICGTVCRSSLTNAEPHISDAGIACATVNWG